MHGQRVADFAHENDTRVHGPRGADDGGVVLRHELVVEKPLGDGNEHPRFEGVLAVVHHAHVHLQLLLLAKHEGVGPGEEGTDSH